jgi:hypothetical protein
MLEPSSSELAGFCSAALAGDYSAVDIEVVDGELAGGRVLHSHIVSQTRLAGRSPIVISHTVSQTRSADQFRRWLAVSTLAARFKFRPLAAVLSIEEEAIAVAFRPAICDPKLKPHDTRAMTLDEHVPLVMVKLSEWSA